MAAGSEFQLARRLCRRQTGGLQALHSLRGVQAYTHKHCSTQELTLAEKAVLVSKADAGVWSTSNVAFTTLPTNDKTVPLPALLAIAFGRLIGLPMFKAWPCWSWNTLSMSVTNDTPSPGCRVQQVQKIVSAKMGPAEQAQQGRTYQQCGRCGPK